MNNLLHRSKSFVNRNASTILTTMGGVGVVATTVIAVKATPKALALIEQAEKEKGEDLTKLEMVKTAGVVYIPTVVAGVATVTCIFGANVLNKRKQASLVSAYALLDNTYKEHKKKVAELYGEDANDRITQEIAKDKYDESELPKEEEKQLFYDDYSKRFFKSTMDDLLKVEHAINRELTTSLYACMNDLYELLELPYIDGGDVVGWTPWMMEEMTWSPWLDLHLVKAELDDGTEYHILTLSCDPFPDYLDY